MILSRTMRPGDFSELEAEIGLVNETLALLGGGDPAQHPCRKWEYALTMRAFMQWLGPSRSAANGGKDGGPVKAADHGCCTGMLAPMLYWNGCDVSMYEVWAWGNQQDAAIRQMEAVKPTKVFTGAYRMINRPLSGLTDEDRDVDAVFCISTIEHVPNLDECLHDLYRCVAPGGMVGITSDFAERGGFGFLADNVRPNGMFCPATYEHMAEVGRQEGLELMGGNADWSWTEDCRMVQGYGFASLFMVKP